MQVSFFVDQYPCYSETFIQNQIDGLLAAGIKVQVITLFSDPTAPINPKLPVKAIYQRPDPKVKMVIKRSLSVISSLFNTSVWRSLSQNQFALLRKNLFLPALAADWHKKHGSMQNDIILAHFGTTAVTAAMLIELGLLQGKLVSVFHGFELSEHQVLARYKKAYRGLFATTELCMPVSQLWAQRLKTLGCPENKIQVHHMGIYADTFSLLEPNRPLNNPIQLLSVARLVEKKGLDDAIDAISLLKQQQIPAKLTIIGDGPLKAALQQHIQHLNLQDRVKLAGALPHSDVKQALERCDIFMLPSKTAANGDMEGIPVSLMEAMARGIIVLSTKHSGISELIKHNENGYLVDENAPEQLAQQIQSIAKANNLSQIRLSARAQIEAHFNQSVLNENLISQLQALHDLS
ncbi:glycosyltransferase [Rheinheimera sp. MMS21-TC3]|uniref:glycosyltransferase n=1 Tax=Rheinheimera sp. MMS21-TC3 TaxID=3072790 RepID=UPI0028C43350|nr:glycosyltransferase [Rheinheimera sp. MMS21-TC3]WNO61668.1 glycosyltransferase [Rheinheimera sp. MMS21-TC3]